jgi:hypothetical protein
LGILVRFDGDLGGKGILGFSEKREKIDVFWKIKKNAVFEDFESGNFFRYFFFR